MSQIENHWSEVSRIETELTRKLVVLGIDWHDEAAMKQLAAECQAFGPEHIQAAYASRDLAQIAKADLFALVSLMLRTMESAARDGREMHPGEVWRALGKYLEK